MADKQTVTYQIRLKDLMSKSLRGLSARVRSFAKRIRTGLVKSLRMARKALKAFAVGVGATTAAMGAIGFAAIRMGKSFLDAASNLEDTQAKFRTVFQGIEEEAQGMVTEIASSMGFGEGSVMGFMSTFQDTLVPLGFAREEAAAMSAGLTSLAADLAAFNPGIRDTEDAIQAMQSVMVGMNRSALRFAVVINEDKIAAEALELGLGNANGELTEQEKVLARLSILMKGTTDAHGAFLRMQDSLTVQTIQFNEAVTDMREEMGARLKTALQDTINGIGGIQVVIDAVRLGFEFFTNVLTQLVIPTVANLLTNFAKFVEGMGGVDGAVMAVSQTIGLLGKAFTTMWKAVKFVFMLFLQGIDTITFAVKALWSITKMLTGLLGLGLVSALRLVIEGFGLFYQGLDRVVVFIRDTAITAFQMLLNTIADVVEGLGDFLTWADSFALVPKLIGDAGRAAAGAASKLRSFSAEQDKLKGGESLYADIGRALDAFGDKLEPVQQELKGFVEASFTELKKHSTDFVNVIMEDVPAIEELYAEIRAGAQGLGADYEALHAQVSQALVQMESVELIKPEQADSAERMREQLERIAGILGAMPSKTDKATESINGMTQGLENFQANVGTIQDELMNMTEGALVAFGNGLTDAFMSIIDGSKSAGAAFREFAAKFLIDIGRMIIQAIIFQAISGALGFFGIGGNTMLGGGGLAKGGTITGGTGELVPLAKGGIVQGGLGRALPMKGYANGGPIVDKPHIALIGEGKHNEAVVPLPDGRSIPVDMQGEGGANVTVQINAVDAKSVDLLFRERKDTLIDVIRQAISQSRSFRSAVGGA